MTRTTAPAKPGAGSGGASDRASLTKITDTQALAKLPANAHDTYKKFRFRGAFPNEALVGTIIELNLAIR